MRSFFYYKMLMLFLIFFGMKSTMEAQIKGMYVNDFKYIIGDTALEDELLEYAQVNGYTYLLFYNLYYIHNNLFSITDPIAAAPLSDFLARAKNDYGIVYTGAVGETFNSFGNIHDYNLDHSGTPAAQFDIYNMEFEFWNSGSTGSGGYYCTTYLEPMPCDTATAFEFYKTQLCQLDSLCDEYDWLQSETYIGSPTDVQCSQLAVCADRVLLHYYRSSDVYGSGNSIYNYKKYRLEPLTDSFPSGSINIMPIFNSRPDFMGPWLSSNPESQAYDTWQNGVNGYVADVGTWKSHMTVDGYIWYRYTDLLTAAPLALSLAYFDIEKEKNYVLLNWSYPYAEKLDRIIIQRSKDLNLWQDIEIVSDIKPSASDIYKYKDKKPLQGKNYYRLEFHFKSKEVDYSTIKDIYINGNSDEVKVYPNPANDFIFVDLMNENEIINISFYDQLGKNVLSQKPVGKKVVTRALSRGIYYMEIRTFSGIFYKKCFIMKE